MGFGDSGLTVQRGSRLIPELWDLERPQGSCNIPNIGALIVRIGFGVCYTIIITRTPQKKTYSHYYGPYIEPQAWVANPGRGFQAGVFGVRLSAFADTLRKMPSTGLSKS